MKKQLLIQLVFAVICLTSASAQTIPIPEILYYKFDGGGAIVPNLAIAPPAYMDTANIINGLTQGSTGQCGGALIGSGGTSSTDYVDTHWAPNLGNGSWSISFWTSGYGNTSSLWYIFGDINTNSFRCFTNGVAGPNNWILRGAGLTDVYVNGGASVGPSMTTFVYDQSLNNVKGYLNGVLVTTVAQTAPNMTGTGPLKVGGYSTNNGHAPGALMDEFRFYNRPLSQAEITLLYNRVNYDTISTTACTNPYTSPSGNYSWSAAGVYSDTLTNIYCGDSIININLSFGSPSSSTISPVACSNYLSPSGNYTWNNSGTYADTIPNFLGCDSVITINLTVNSLSLDTITTTSCNQYVSPSGMYTWTSSGTYYDTLHYSGGCDSIAYTLYLTITDSSSSIISPVACGSYTSPSGSNTWTSSGTYIDILPNAQGCDSVITINLTVNNPNVNVTQSGPTLTAAASGATYQWLDCANGQPVAGATGQSYTALVDGNYAVVVTQNGCTDTSNCFLAMVGGIEEGTWSDLSVYPNPTDGTLNISLGHNIPEFTVELMNNLGQVVYRRQYTQSSLVSMEMNTAPGVYYLRISADGEQITLPISKR